MQTPVEFPALETRHDVFIDDAIGLRVGHRAFQSVADFDAQLAIVLRHEQEEAVVHVFPSQLPCFDHADAVLLDGFRGGAGHDQDRDLAALLAFEFGQGLFQRILFRSVQRPG